VCRRKIVYTSKIKNYDQETGKEKQNVQKIHEHHIFFAQPKKSMIPEKLKKMKLFHL